MALTTGSIVAICFIIIGIILLIVGIIFFEINRSNNKSQPWWVWLLMIGGAVLAIIGGIFLAFSLRDTGTVKVVPVQPTTLVQPAPIIAPPPVYPVTNNILYQPM